MSVNSQVKTTELNDENSKKLIKELVELLQDNLYDDLDEKSAREFLNEAFYFDGTLSDYSIRSAIHNLVRFPECIDPGASYMMNNLDQMYDDNMIGEFRSVIEKLFPNCKSS